MGPLHNEMLLLSMIGDWLAGSGWSKIYKRTEISTPGRIDSFLKRKKVKRSRYAHQVTLATLVQLAWQAYQQTQHTNYEQWRNEVSVLSATETYWFTTIELETKLFMFVKSVRLTDFDLFLRCLEDILLWVFAVGHVNYARWLKVFVQDLKRILNQRNVLHEFYMGRFTAQKTGCMFSNMGADQAHEQNKVIKADGGTIGIFDNESGLSEWRTSGTQISEMLSELSNCSDDDESDFQYRDEDNDAFELKFRFNRENLLAAFEEFGNPFNECESNLMNIVSKVALGEDASESARHTKSIGLAQRSTFTQDRLISRTKSLYDNIAQTKWPLLRQMVI